ncbi:MAG: glutathione S-transferase family protein [Cyanobacteriota bacterium]
MSALSSLPSWEQLSALAPPPSDRVLGPTNAQADLRLFGQPESAVRVTLYRDHHAWCPYCQKVWLWLEERRIPYRVRKVSMVCYGEKERWYRDLVPTGYLPALALDGVLITESDRILESLELAFGPLGQALVDPDVRPLRQLERRLFRAWCQWLCYPGRGAQDEEVAEGRFDAVATEVAEALQRHPGPFFLAPAPSPEGDGFSSADLVFVPFLERINASLTYYKGYQLRQRHPALQRWFSALEQRSTYLGTQSDFHTHAHDLPPQMGGCHASGTERQRLAAARIDQGPWLAADASASAGFDGETSQQVVAEHALEALARVVRHRQALIARNPDQPERFDPALRGTLARMVGVDVGSPPAGSAPGLRYLRDRISVPRDMSLLAARCLRQALENTAALDGPGQGPLLPVQHRRDQDPLAFRQAGAPA